MTTLKHTRRQQQVAQRRKANLQSVAVLGLIGVLVGALLIVSLSSGASSAAGKVSVARVGAPISDLALTDLQGQTHRLSDLKGQVVLINGWATWCPPCRAEMPGLHEFYLAHQAAGLELWAVNSGEDQATVGAFIRENQFTFPALLDDNHTLDALGVNGLPTTIVVGRDGVVKYIHTGAISAATLEQKVLPLLQ